MDIRKITLGIVALGIIILGASYFVSGGNETAQAATEPLASASADKAATAKADPNAPMWSVRCNAPPKDKPEEANGPKRGRCEVFQRLIVAKTGQRVVEAAVGYPKDKNTARGIFILPLGVMLQTGMQLKIGDAAPLKFQARFCDVAGCFAYVDMTESILESMRQSQDMTISFQSAADQKTINVVLSLKDFAKTLKEVS